MTTTTTEYASQGGVRQHGGSLPIRRCAICGEEIVFPTSKRTGRKYPVSVSRGYKGQRFYVGANIHRCERPRQESAWQAASSEARNFSVQMAIAGHPLEVARMTPPAIEQGKCRNCGEDVTSRYGGRWSSDQHGDVCYQAHLDRNGPYSGIVINRIHAVDVVR